MMLSWKKYGDMKTKKMSYRKAMDKRIVATLIFESRITLKNTTQRHIPKMSCSTNAQGQLLRTINQNTAATAEST